MIQSTLFYFVIVVASAEKQKTVSQETRSCRILLFCLLLYHLTSDAIPSKEDIP